MNRCDVPYRIKEGLVNNIANSEVSDERSEMKTDRTCTRKKWRHSEKTLNDERNTESFSAFSLRPPHLPSRLRSIYFSVDKKVWHGQRIE